MTYQENKKYFYPQENNPNYNEKEAKIVGWNWIINACDSENHHDFRLEIKALRQMKNSTLHEISRIIYEILIMKKTNIPKICKSLNNIKKYARLRIKNI